MRIIFWFSIASRRVERAQRTTLEGALRDDARIAGDLRHLLDGCDLSRLVVLGERLEQLALVLHDRRAPVAWHDRRVDAQVLAARLLDLLLSHDQRG